MAPARVFVARMVGLAVFGPDGERIGKVRDVVASLRVDDNPPRDRPIPWWTGSSYRLGSGSTAV